MPASKDGYGLVAANMRVRSRNSNFGRRIASTAIGRFVDREGGLSMITNEGSDIAISGRLRNVVHVLFIVLALNCATYAAPQSQEPQKPAEQRQKPATGATR